MKNNLLVFVLSVSSSLCSHHSLTVGEKNQLKENLNHHYANDQTLNAKETIVRRNKITPGSYVKCKPKTEIIESPKNEGSLDDIFKKINNGDTNLKPEEIKSVSLEEFKKIVSGITEKDLNLFKAGINGLRQNKPEIETVEDEKSIAEAKAFFFIAGINYLNDDEIINSKCSRYPKNKLIVTARVVNNDPKLKAAILVDNENKDIIISFRGVEGNDMILKLASFNTVKYGENSNGNVHNKTMGYLIIILPKIVKSLKNTITEENKNYRIVLVGHSLGGALALLAAPKIKKELGLNYNNMAIYTYNQYMVGDKEFINWIDNLSMNILRVVDIKDIVPNLPPFGDWAHTKRVIKLNGASVDHSVGNQKFVLKLEDLNEKKLSQLHNKLWGYNLGIKHCIE